MLEKLAADYTKDTYNHPDSVKSLNPDQYRELIEKLKDLIKSKQTELEKKDYGPIVYFSLLSYQVRLAELYLLSTKEEDVNQAWETFHQALATLATIHEKKIHPLFDQKLEDKKEVNYLQYYWGVQYYLWMARIHTTLSTRRTNDETQLFGELTLADIYLARASQLKADMLQNPTPGLPWTTELSTFLWSVTNLVQERRASVLALTPPQSPVWLIALPYVISNYIKVISKSYLYKLQKEDSPVIKGIVALDSCSSTQELIYRCSQLEQELLKPTPHMGVARSVLTPKHYYQLKLKRLAAEWPTQIERLADYYDTITFAQPDLFTLTQKLQMAQELRAQYKRWWIKLSKSLKKIDEKKDNNDVETLSITDEDLKVIEDPVLIADINRHKEAHKTLVGLVKLFQTAHEERTTAFMHQNNRALCQSYYVQLYQSFERLFLACKSISSGLLAHTHQTALGNAGVIIQTFSGLVKFIPVVGPSLLSVVSAVGQGMKAADYQRILNYLRQLDTLLSSEGSKMLAHQLATALVERHARQLPCIVGVPDTKILEDASTKILAKHVPSPFERVAEYYCARLFVTWCAPTKRFTRLLEESQSTSSRAQSIRMEELFETLLEAITCTPPKQFYTPVKDKVEGGIFSTHKVILKLPGEKTTQECTLAVLFNNARVFAFEPSKGLEKAKCRLFTRNPSHPSGIHDDHGLPCLQLPSAQVLKRKDSFVESMTDSTKLDNETLIPFEPDFESSDFSYPALVNQVSRLVSTQQQHHALLERLGEEISALKNANTLVPK